MLPKKVSKVIVNRIINSNKQEKLATKGNKYFGVDILVTSFLYLIIEVVDFINTFENNSHGNNPLKTINIYGILEEYKPDIFPKIKVKTIAINNGLIKDHNHPNAACLYL